MNLSKIKSVFSYPVSSVCRSVKCLGWWLPLKGCYYFEFILFYTHEMFSSGIILGVKNKLTSTKVCIIFADTLTNVSIHNKTFSLISFKCNTMLTRPFRLSHFSIESLAFLPIAVYIKWPGPWPME